MEENPLLQESTDLASVSKKKFGFTLHENMSLGDIAEKWVSKASNEIKQAYPELTALFTTASIQIEAEKTLRQIQVTADTTYKTLQGVIEDATAILTGQVQQPAVKAAASSTKIATEVQVEVMDDIKGQAINLLLDI